MPGWMIVDVIEGVVYVVAFVMLVVFLGAWGYWFIKPWLVKREQQRAWQKQFVKEMLQEGRASFAASLPLPSEEVWDEHEQGPKWQGESFKDYQQAWADWYTTERKV